MFKLAVAVRGSFRGSVSGSIGAKREDQPFTVVCGTSTFAVFFFSSSDGASRSCDSFGDSFRSDSTMCLYQ